MSGVAWTWLKPKLRRAHRIARRSFVKAFRSYDRPKLIDALSAAGLRPGDSVMLHSAFEEHHGFRGGAVDVIEAFRSTVGPTGNLMMVSLPYRSSTRDWIERGKLFDARRTPSAMGLISETFRRMPDVRRSVHPTHPVLAAGPLAEWLLASHRFTHFPCGPDSPFERLLSVRGKVAFFNVPFSNLTFFHYLEHRVRGVTGLKLYDDTLCRVPAIDADGQRHIVETYVFSRDIIPRRRFDILEQQARSSGLIREVRVGASYVLVSEVEALVECTDRMLERGLVFYDRGAVSAASGT